MEIKLGFFGVLTLIFVTLKLTGFIAWSWWWVLAPTWIPLALVISVAGFCFVMAFIVAYLNHK